MNGFHDTANAVATVIYTNALPANVAVVWSGFFNFLGVLLSTGAVAFGIVSLLPVELILQVGSNAGFAMVFALLISAILWNLATWWLGIPSSSSHTLIGSIIGVGVANALLHGKSGVPICPASRSAQPEGEFVGHGRWCRAGPCRVRDRPAGRWISTGQRAPSEQLRPVPRPIKALGFVGLN